MIQRRETTNDLLDKTLPFKDKSDYEAVAKLEIDLEQGDMLTVYAESHANPTWPKGKKAKEGSWVTGIVVKLLSDEQSDPNDENEEVSKIICKKRGRDLYRSMKDEETRFGTWVVPETGRYLVKYIMRGVSKASGGEVKVTYARLGAYSMKMAS